MSGERRGVPSVAIMTERFVSAADLMARAIGAPGYPFVTIAHPISSATANELDTRARRAAGEAVRLLAGAGSENGGFVSEPPVGHR